MISIIFIWLSIGIFIDLEKVFDAYDGLLLVQRIIIINIILSIPFLLSTLYIYGVMAIVHN